MTDTPQPEDPAGDYSYDLVHEEVRLAHGDPGRTARWPRVPVTMHAPEDGDGDYSYDLAHDIPAQGS
jgi:hypothetical protein